MAARTLLDPSPTGGADTFTAASAGGDTYPLPGKITLRFRNAHASEERTVTMVGRRACNHGTIHNLPVAVPALSTVVVAVDDVNRFKHTDGLIYLTYSSEADLSTQGALRD